MQRRILLVPLFGLMLVVTAPAQTPPQAPQPPAGEPKIVLSQDSWDFGTVVHLDKPEFTLTITNAGAAELKISKVNSSCGCTAAQPGKFNLLPGESTPLKVTYNTRGKKGKNDATITIESNDKSNPKKVFRVEGEVKRAVRVEPESAVFRVLGPDEALSIPLRIVNESEQPMQLKLGPYSTGKFAAQLKEIQPGKDYELIVVNKPPIPERVMADTLDITTGLADEPRLEITTQLLQIDRVNFLQPALLVTGDANEERSCGVEIEYFGNDANFQITKATCDDPKVTPQLGLPFPPPEGRPGRKPTSIIMLSVDFPPGTVFPPAGLLIRVFTSDPEYPELKIMATPDMARYRDLTLRGRSLSQRKAP